MTESSAPSTTAAPPGTVETHAFPCSVQQQRFWLLDQVNPDAAAYTIPIALRLSGPLNPASLEAAVNCVVERHESLRTVFPLEGETPVQIVRPHVRIGIAIEEVSAMESPDEDPIAAALQREANRPFDLATGPVIRARLYRLGPNEHVLALTLHHIVADGWSIGILLKEVAAAYTALAKGLPPAFEPLPLQYPDYAVWQRRVVDGPAVSRQLTWWKNELQGPLPSLDLATDRPRPAVLRYEGDKRESSISAATATSIRDLARRSGATPYSAFLTAFQILLHRLSGQDDIIVGSITSGRHRVETQRLIGLFVNTLAIRADLSAQPSFTALLERTRDRVLGALSNQDVPFERVVEEVQPDWDRSRSPVFQAAFQLLEGLAEGLALPGIAATHLPARKATSKFELTLMLHAEPSGGLRAVIEYCSELFSPASIDRMLRHYEALLIAIAAKPDEPAERLTILPDDERTRVVYEWNDTDAPYPDGAVLNDLIEVQVDRTPDAVAVEWEGGRATFAELDQRANQLAHRLVALGIGPDQGVGLCAERSLDLVVGMLAVLKAGGYYVPLDPDYPTERLARMMGNAPMRAILVQARWRSRVPESGAEIVLLDDSSSAWPTHRLPQRATPDDLAYVIYTSGSTGLPKGVMIPRRAVVNYVHWMQGAFPVTADDAVLQKAPAGFDASVWEFYLPLVSGARLVLNRAGAQLDPADLAKAIVRHGVTVLQLVPTQLFLMLETGAIRDCTTVRQIFCGGEALPADLLGRLAEALPRVGVTNLYGPTEATVYATFWSLDRAAFDGTAPIGRPIANDRVYIVDRAGQPCPIAVPGELWIGGVGVGRGYLNQPDLTRERFIADPFRPDSGNRVYRTGDLARWRDDGSLQYLGRIDNQVKLRGFRIELGEIESALVGQPGIRGAVAMVRGDRLGNFSLAAYVVAEPGALSPAGLREALRKTLPEYMIPASVTVLDEFPTTPNGKIDRRAFPEPAQSAKGRDITAPVTEAERIVATTMANVLSLETVGRDEDFFRLGGHSLLVMRLVSRLRDGFGPDVTIQSVFENPTPARLAARLRPPGLEDTASLIARRPDGSTSPLSFAQELIWVQSEMDRTSAAYNVPIARKVLGPFNPDAWQVALNQLVIRHDSLRSIVQLQGGIAQMVVQPPAPVPMEYRDLREMKDPHNEAIRHGRNAAAAPFDLGVPPLIRSSVFRTADAEFIVLLLGHHIAIDGGSIAILWSDLVALYDAAMGGGKASLPTLPIRYGDYAAWQRDRLRGAALDQMVDSWRAALSGCPTVVDLPTDRPRGRLTFGTGDQVTTTVPLEILSALERLAADRGATLYMVLLAAWQVLVHRYSQQSDFVVGSPVGGRPTPETERIVGDFVNTVLMRAQLHDDPTFEAFLDRTRTVVIGALSQSELPLEHLSHVFRERGGSAPQIQLIFVLQNNPASDSSFAGCTTEPVRVHGGAVQFELSLSAATTRGGLRATLSYRDDLFERATIERMLAHWEILLSGIAREPGMRIGRLPLMNPEEAQRLIGELSRGTDVPRSGWTIIEAFDQQAAATPSAPAVEWEGGRLSYGELSGRVNRLAAQLTRRRIGPGQLVAIHMHRSAGLAVAMLGTLKAGAAYLPVDPAYPSDRIAFMLSDAAVSLVLTGVNSSLPPGEPTPTIALDDSGGLAEEAAGASESLTALATLDDAAYVLYTSGSTGRPKGVVVSHRSIANHMEWMQANFPCGPADAVLQKTPISFDASIWEFYAPLLAGGRLIMATPNGHADPAYLIEAMRQSGTTVIQIVPAMLALLVDTGELATCRRLARVFCGGEALQPDLVTRFFAACPAALINLYGPTEATIDATSWVVDHTTFDHRVSVGRPLENMQTYVLDTNRGPVPAGVPGELALAGLGLATGYLNRPELTAEKFVANPFGRSADKLYLTGDRARWRSDGSLEYLGRFDHQVKLRGYRIELGEIESALSAVEGVAEAAVVIREDTPEDRRLTGYLTWRPGRQQEMPAVRAALARSLPSYMVPATLTVLEAMPHTPSGKIDRQALPVPSIQRRDIAAPQTPEETILRRLWARLLHREDIDRCDNFFDLGGHSLLAVRLSAELAKVFRFPVQLRVLFDHPTLAAMAKALDDAAPKPGQARRIAELVLRIEAERATASSGES